ETIAATGEELDVDGIRIVFQNTPDAEAPSEMNFFFPDKSLLCLAENCTHNLHNLYPIRGAQTRDALAWSKYLQEALVMWGDHTDVCFASHHWPRFGREDAKAFIALQRDVYRWMHDQTLRLANHGHTPDEIADELALPECFAHQSHVQGYYGTVSHNVRSVYTRYLGWYDGNPANLHPLPPVESARRYVSMMGGADNVLDGARRAYADGEYRWVAQVLNHVIFDDPTNQEARRLSADAMEQLGYQSESATWRNAYLMGAFELRHGSLDLGRARQPPMAKAMTGELLIDSMGVRFDPGRYRATATILWRLSDVGEDHLLEVSNHAISQRRLDAAEPGWAAAPTEVDVVVSLDRAAMVAVIDEADRFGPLVDDGTITIESGDAAVAAEFLAALDVFQTANIVEP
ncbi:MAG: MBL fold metallo-hydrolase, partial [Microthrixaceae bacterium]|nr:MBL fold metallo-hydrolase [Microthrixaceae bacterium]